MSEDVLWTSTLLYLSLYYLVAETQKHLNYIDANKMRDKVEKSILYIWMRIKMKG